MARDDNNIYFYVATASPMTAKTDAGWMRLFIDIDNDKNTGWEGYDFVINRLSPNKKATIEKSDGGWLWSKAGEADYAVKGNQLEISVPKNILHLEAGIDFGFKWSDNMQEDGDIMDFLVNGDAAPLGRFNYHYMAP